MLRASHAGRVDKTPAQPLSPAERRRWTRIGIMAALALLLGYAETFVPIPLPGVKLGLANIAILATIALGDATGAWCVAAIKVLASGLLFGSPLTMAYAAVGTVLAMTGMVGLSRLRTMRLWMVSVVGSLLHELGQLLVASLLMGTGVIWHLAPVLYLAGCVTGALCGMLAQRLVWAFAAADAHGVVVDERQPAEAQPPELRVRVAFVILVAFVVVVLHQTSPAVLAALVATVLACCVAMRVAPRAIVATLVPLAGIAGATLVLQLLVAPQDAVVVCAIAVLRLAAITFASIAFMRLVPTEGLASIVAWLVSPLTRRGVRTQGFVLALDVALGLVPKASATVREYVRTQGSPRSLRALRAMLLGLIEQLTEQR